MASGFPLAFLALVLVILAEFSSKLASENHFLNSVVSGDKVFLIGDENELGKLCTERLDHSTSDKSRRGQKLNASAICSVRLSPTGVKKPAGRFPDRP
jgi:hypothetical protein